MKAFFTVFFIFFSSVTHAHHVGSHHLPTFEECDGVQLALLNKDNRPYWAPTPQAGNVSNCYQDIKTFTLTATPQMIERFSQEYEGQIVIFNNDIEFADFIQQNAPQFDPDAEITPATFTPQITVISPATPQPIFGGIFQ